MSHKATMLDYSLIAPPKDLAGYVKFYYTLSALPNAGDHFIFRTMANGCPVLFFHYKGSICQSRIGETSGTVLYDGLYGVAEKNNRFKLSPDFGIIGLCLYPFALNELFNIPCAEVVDQVVSLQEVIGEEAEYLKEQVASCDTNDARVEIVSSFIRLRLKQVRNDQPHFDHAVSEVMRSKGYVDIAGLADDFALTRRTFERRFKVFCGMSPKSYSNVIRFQYSVDALTAERSSLTTVAYQCGYYDQSHFTNDFTRFSGFSPKHFTANNPENDPLWLDFVAFFQFLSWCPPVLCSGNKT